MRVELSIEARIAALPSVELKEYIWTMADHGLEMGIGRSGSYVAHAHRNLADILFAPKGLRSGSTGSSRYASGSLLAALPGTWFGPVTTDNFFFIKFYCDKNLSGVPDKIVNPGEMDKKFGVASGGLMVAHGSVVLRLPIFRPGRQDEATGTAEICLTTDGLSCQFPGHDVLIVTK
jgi:hypothetical protein